MYKCNLYDPCWHIFNKSYTAIVVVKGEINLDLDDFIAC